jgi:hypothetical protein
MRGSDLPAWMAEYLDAFTRGLQDNELFLAAVNKYIFKRLNEAVHLIEKLEGSRCLSLLLLDPRGKALVLQNCVLGSLQVRITLTKVFEMYVFDGKDLCERQHETLFYVCSFCPKPRINSLELDRRVRTRARFARVNIDCSSST